jgi:hypothetical protein
MTRWAGPSSTTYDFASPGVVPVPRLWKPTDGGHFYTIQESGKDELIDGHSHIYTYEGVVRHAYE